MDNTFKELWILRSMRIVAVLAIHDRCFDLKMSLAERSAFAVMALPAQGLNWFRHQIFLF